MDLFDKTDYNPQQTLSRPVKILGLTLPGFYLSKKAMFSFRFLVLN